MCLSRPCRLPITVASIGSINWQNSRPVKRVDPRDAFWVSTLQNDANNQTLAFAALKGELWPTAFNGATSRRAPRICRSEAAAPKAWKRLWSGREDRREVDPVLVGYWEDRRPTQALAEVGRIMGESVRQGRPMRMIEPGWSTWHSYSARYGRGHVEGGTIHEGRTL